MSIANKSLSDFRTDLRRRLNEVAAAGRWTNSELNTRINRALLRVTIDTENDTAESTVNLRLNVAWYRLPSDCIMPLFLYGPSTWDYARIFPTQLTKLDRNDFRGMGGWEKSGSARSTLFVPFSYDKFILWPPPNASTTVTLFYVPTPTTLSGDSDTTALQASAQQLVPIYAAYLALRKDNFQKAIIFLQEYKQRLGIVKSEIQNTAAVRSVRMAPAKPWERAHGNPTIRMR